MPAVQLARLKEQINQLSWHFTRPDEFRKHLNDLLDAYSDRTYHLGQAVKHRPLIAAYHVNPLVMRQLEHDLSRLCQENPGAALTLADLLWKDLYIEPRLLAASLLGQTPLNPPEPVLERLLAWGDPALDNPVLEALVMQGSFRLRQEMPGRWFVLVENWLTSSDLALQAVGIKALLPMILDREFENLPPIFRLLSPLVQTAPNQLQSELQHNIEALARRSPVETAYFLRQMLSLATGPGANRLIRRCLPAFPEETRDSLRTTLLTRSSDARNR